VYPRLLSPARHIARRSLQVSAAAIPGATMSSSHKAIPNACMICMTASVVGAGVMIVARLTPA
jgi:hypothetical protein